MSRVTTTEVILDAPDLEPVESEAPQAPAKKPSKSDAAKADVATETEETP
jgi:hypothetical protein